MNHNPHMGDPNRYKNGKSKQTVKESNESSDSDQSSQQPISQPTWNVPHLLVVKSEEKDRKVSDLSPFCYR